MKNVIKAARMIVSICVATVIVVATAVFMSTVTFDNTVFSSGYFNRVYDENITRQDISRVFFASSENIAGYLPLDKKERDSIAKGSATPELLAFAASYKQLFRIAVQDQWFSDEISLIIKGSYRYLSHESDELPAIDVRGFKDMLVKAFTYQIIADNEAAIRGFDNSLDTLKKFAGGIKLGGAYKEMVIGQMMGMKQLSAMNITRADAIKIIDHYENAKINDLDAKDVMTFAVGTLLEGKFAKAGTAAGTKDKIEMSTLAGEIYGSDTNPLTGLRGLLWNLRMDILTLDIIMLILLVILLSILVKKPFRIIRFIGISLLLPGLLFLAVPAAWMLAGDLFTPSLTVQTITGISFDLSLVGRWIKSFITGTNLFMAKAGGLAALSGLILVVASFIKIRRNAPAREVNSSKTNTARITTVRTAAAVLLMAAILLTVLFYSKSIADDIDEYSAILKAADERKDEIDINSILSKALGIDSFIFSQNYVASGQLKLNK